MEILNFGQLSLAAEKDRSTLCYVVMYGNKVKRVGTIPPQDYTITRYTGHGRINIPREYELGFGITWRTYSKVEKCSLGLDTLYVGISREETLNKVKEELEHIDEEIQAELRYFRDAHRKIATSLKTIQTELEYVSK